MNVHWLAAGEEEDRTFSANPLISGFLNQRRIKT
jgi:hypothetical protein